MKQISPSTDRELADLHPAQAWSHDDPGGGIDDVNSRVKYNPGDSEPYREVEGNAPNQLWVLRMKLRIPQNFAGFQASAIEILNKVSAAPGNTSVTIWVYDTGGTLRHVSDPLQNTSKSTYTVTSTHLAAGVFTPGGEFEILVQAVADNGKIAYIGNVKPNFRRRK